MLARIAAAAVSGIDAIPVSVEVDVSPGLPGVTMVGLPDAIVRESRDRVRTAIRNSGFPFPTSRVTVSLAPADVRKIGAAFDLPIALGILAASGVLPHRDGPPMTIVGGLSLDGGVPPMHALLPIAVAARRTDRRSLMFPASNLQEAGIVDELQLFPVQSLWEAVRVLVDSAPPAARRPCTSTTVDPVADDLADVRGQLTARRGLEIAAAGAHHLLLNGPPGAGKTMLARRLPGLLPPLTLDEALVVTTIHSVAGLLAPGSGLVITRPFRAPHHTCSDVALVGGGSIPRPGELSLAHSGVLFLDELPEFGRRVLESLRQPLEQGVVHIARAARTMTFPASVTLIAAMNPCPGVAKISRRLQAVREISGYPKQLSALADHLRKCIMDRGLSQKAAAEHMGRDATTVANWLFSRAQPDLRSWPIVISWLGYDPRPQATGTGESLVNWRKGRGWSQKKVAHLLKVDPSVAAR